jgi:hypothetical protein
MAGMTLRRAASTAVLIGVLLVLAGTAGATRSAKALKVSRCPGPANAEVVQAVDGHYVYEAWIGCNHAIGFARSVDGGKTFGPATAVRGSNRTNTTYAWDPALAVAADGTVYVGYMVGPRNNAWHGLTPMAPAVAVSHDHGQSFDRVSHLPVPASPDPNFGDRVFLAVGSHGVLYATWDYGPRRDQEKIVCPPTSSCYFAGGEFNAVLQKSTDGGKTWTKLVPISSDYPYGGVWSAPIVAEPNGALDVLFLQHPTNHDTLVVSPGHEYFSRSTNGGSSWSNPVLVGPHAGTLGVKAWWINGSLAVDSAGTLYAGWDTQGKGRDTAWLAWSTNGGKKWSSPVQVAASPTEHLTEVAVAGRGDVYVAWQTIVSGKGYATYLRRYSVAHGWTGPPTKISPAYGKPKVWPGDTFGLSTIGSTALVSWGSATGARSESDIWFSTAKLPAR